MAANQANHAATASNGPVRSSRNVRFARLRTIQRVALILIGLDAISSLYPMPVAARLGAVTAALILSIIGIAAIVRLWWLESHLPPPQHPIHQLPANPAEREHTPANPNDYRDVRRGRPD